MKKINTDKYCHRCGNEFGVGKIMSWFTTEMICDKCLPIERALREKFPHKANDYEGCGFIPEPLDITPKDSYI
jgi:hypothetical protein